MSYSFLFDNDFPLSIGHIHSFLTLFFLEYVFLLQNCVKTIAEFKFTVYSYCILERIFKTFSFSVRVIFSLSVELLVQLLTSFWYLNPPIFLNLSLRSNSRFVYTILYYAKQKLETFNFTAVFVFIIKEQFSIDSCCKVHIGEWGRVIAIKAANLAL